MTQAACLDPVTPRPTVRARAGPELSRDKKYLTLNNLTHQLAHRIRLIAPTVTPQHITLIHPIS
jgi:hypothetical protein